MYNSAQPARLPEATRASSDRLRMERRRRKAERKLIRRFMISSQHLFNRMAVSTSERAAWLSCPIHEVKARLAEIRNADMQQWERRLKKLDKEQQAEAISRLNQVVESMEGLSCQEEPQEHSSAHIEEHEYSEQMDIDIEMES